MITNKMNLIKQILWRRISQSEIRNSAAAEKNWNRKARAGKNSFPPTPFLFARPSDWISEFAIRIFVKKSSDFNQKAPPESIIYSRNCLFKGQFLFILRSAWRQILLVQ
jgi:hypothetical protein